ncbi:hypothetical protein ACROYT_G021894 [Oculina patagonica]
MSRSSGHCTMSSRTWVSRLLCITFVYTAMKCQETYGRCNCVFTLKGNTYNITSLQSADDTARFTVEHQGYTYSYNPCRSFHFVEEPSFGDCKDDLAMCWWIKDIMYRKIAEQSTAKCDFNEQYKMPMLQYTGDGYIRKTAVLLKCNQTNKQASFEVVDTSRGGEFESRRLKTSSRAVQRLEPYNKSPAGQSHSGLQHGSSAESLWEKEQTLAAAEDPPSWVKELLKQKEYGKELKRLKSEQVC